MKSSDNQNLYTRLAILFVLLIAWGVRAALLEQAPGGIQHDEVSEAVHAFDVLAGRFQLYYYVDGFGPREPMMANLQAPFLAVIGQNLWGLRLLSAISGVLTVALTYALGRRFFARNVALLAAGLIATAFWPLVMSVLALRGVLVPPLAALAIYLLWRGMEKSASIRLTVAAGIAGMAAVYAYLAGWMLPLIGVAFLLSTLLFDWARINRNGEPNRIGRQVLAWTLTCGLLAAPLVYANATSAAADRLRQLSPLLARAQAGDFTPLLQNILDVLGSFSVRGDQFGLYNIPNQPILPVAFALFFYIGAGVSLWRWRQPAYRLLLLWLLIGFLPAALAVGGPNHLRSVVSLPPTYLLVALGATTTFLALWEKARWEKALWGRTLPTLASAVLAGLLLWGVQSQLTDFMINWRENADTRYFFRTSLVETVRRLPSEQRSCISTPYLHDWSPLIAEYLVDPANVDICWFYGKRGLVFPAGSGPIDWYIPAAISPDSYLADQENAELAPALQALLQPTVGESVERFSDGTPIFTQYTAAERRQVREVVSTRVPPTVYGWGPGVNASEWRSGEARLGAGLALAGTQVLTPSGADEPLRVLLLWKIVEDHRINEPFSIFVQLLTANAEYVAGDDHLDYAVNSWRAGDLFVQLHQIDLPPDLSPGSYYLQTGLYNWQSGERSPLLVDGQPMDSRILLPPIDLP